MSEAKDALKIVEREWKSALASLERAKNALDEISDADLASAREGDEEIMPPALYELMLKIQIAVSKGGKKFLTASRAAKSYVENSDDAKSLFSADETKEDKWVRLVECPTVMPKPCIMITGVAPNAPAIADAFKKNLKKWGEMEDDLEEDEDVRRFIQWLCMDLRTIYERGDNTPFFVRVVTEPTETRPNEITICDGVDTSVADKVADALNTLSRAMTEQGREA